MRPALNGSNDEVFVTFDGQSGHALEPDDVISVRAREQAAAPRARVDADLLRCAATEVEME